MPRPTVTMPPWLRNEDALGDPPGSRPPRWLIDVRDLKDHRVRCDPDWWQVHVVGDHPECADEAMVQAARDALTDPACIAESKTVGNRRCFYRPVPAAYGQFLAKVVVEYPRFRRPGIVMTAFRVPGVT